MKFKLDENLGKSAVAAFEASRHDTSSIHRQGMDGANDATVFDVCCSEQRILVTLDLDFANPLNFDPRETAGVAVLRLEESGAAGADGSDNCAVGSASGPADKRIALDCAIRQDTCVDSII